MRRWTLANARLAIWLVPTASFLVAWFAIRNGAAPATEAEIAAALPGARRVVTGLVPAALAMVLAVRFGMPPDTGRAWATLALVAAWLTAGAAAMSGLVLYTLTLRLGAFVAGYAILLLGLFALPPSRYGLGA